MHALVDNATNVLVSGLSYGAVAKIHSLPRAGASRLLRLVSVL